MRRRDAIVALTCLGVARGTPRAQERRSRPARIAILDDAPPTTRASAWRVFFERLRDLGHVEGRNLEVTRRFGEGDAARLPALAEELVALRPDVLVVVTTGVAMVARRATSDIPIVAMGPADPVKSGLVASLGRPGGNVTGVSQNQAEIAGKWVELARELAPNARTLLYLTDVGNSGEMIVFDTIRAKAAAVGMTADVADGIDAAKVEGATRTMERTRPDVLIVATTSSVLPQRRQIIAAVERLRIPAIYARREYVDDGGLLSYGTQFHRVMIRGAEYVDQILMGGKPSEIPFEMASTFELVINLKAARAIGRTMPPAVLARADEVIGE